MLKKLLIRLLGIDNILDDIKSIEKTLVYVQELQNESETELFHQSRDQWGVLHSLLTNQNIYPINIMKCFNIESTPMLVSDMIRAPLHHKVTGLGHTDRIRYTFVRGVPLL